MTVMSWTKQAALGAALGAALWAAAPSAQAAVIVTGPATYNLAFSTVSNNATLTAGGTLEIKSLTATAMQIEIVLNNTTPLAMVGGNRLTAFGMDINPGSVTGATSLTAGWDASVGNSAFLPSDIGNIDLCVHDTSKCNNAAPGNSGIMEASSKTLLINLTGSFSTPFSITDVYVRFVSVGTGSNGSIAFAGTISAPTPPPPPPPPPPGGGDPSQVNVPAPAALGMFGLALLGLGLARRRRD